MTMAVSALFVVLWLYLKVVSGASEEQEDLEEKFCEEITLPMCKGIGYNFTSMPNTFNHDRQGEAGLEVNQFWPLVQINCSPSLRFFLCSMYIPICLNNYRRPLPPCRALCERARSGCAPLMQQFGFDWPDRLRCDLLPEADGSKVACMDNTTKETTSPPLTSPPLSSPPFSSPPLSSPPLSSPPLSSPPLSTSTPSPTLPPSSVPSRIAELTPCEDLPCKCKEPMVDMSSERRDSRGLASRIRSLAGSIPTDCAMSCRSPFFGSDEQAFVALWIGLWATLCFTSCLATVLTFLIDPTRFQYPERPIVFISLCYLFVSLGYIARLLAGHEAVACDQNLRTVYYAATGPALCTVVFFLIYFFGMAAAVWWVVLSLVWFLAAGLKWGSEAIVGYSHYFHLVAWFVPSVKVVIVLALSAIDGDPLAGICYVGNQDTQALRGFVLIPLALYLLVGFTFLMAGFVSLVRIRSAIKQGGRKTDKLERLMLRLGAVALLYTVPAAATLVCHLYEQHYREAWQRTWNCAGECTSEDEQALRPRPAFAIFMIKYLAALLAGLASTAWLCSAKTVDAWKTFCTRCFWSRKETLASGGLAPQGVLALRPTQAHPGSEQHLGRLCREGPDTNAAHCASLLGHAPARTSKHVSRTIV
uniref:frizzled-8-like n=1 Tax=Myxine glutinosa TaxID=7769 RepID=UPI00358EBBB7